jgi:hypothetical protein
MDETSEKRETYWDGKSCVCVVPVVDGDASDGAVPAKILPEVGGERRDDMGNGGVFGNDCGSNIRVV